MNSPHVLKDMPENTTRYFFLLSDFILWFNHEEPQWEILTLPL